jgi:hypothetical protein
VFTYEQTYWPPPSHMRRDIGYPKTVYKYEDDRLRGPSIVKRAPGATEYSYLDASDPFAARLLAACELR